MQMLLPLIAIMILGVVEVTTKQNPTSTPNPTPKKDVTEKQSIIPTQTSQLETGTNTSVTIITSTTPTAQPQQTAMPANYIFPHADVVSQSKHEIHLQSLDSAQNITEWYKSYIQNNNMNTTSFVTTNTNNNILNKLAGAKNNEKIEIEIERKNGENKTNIKILLSS